MPPDAVEYRPSLVKTLGMAAFFALMAAGGVWVALRPDRPAFDRLIGLAAAGLFSSMAAIVLVATLRHRAYLRLDARGLRMVDRLGRPRLDVPWTDIVDAYEARVGRDDLVILVAGDTPNNRGDGLSAPQSLTGPDGKALGYGYVVDPRLVDVRAPDLIDQVRRHLGDRLGGWDPVPPGG